MKELLRLKAEYKAVSGKDYKPPAANSTKSEKKQNATKTQKKDQPVSVQVMSNQAVNLIKSSPN